MKTTALLTKTQKVCALLLCVSWAIQSARATQYTVEMTEDWTFSPSYLIVEVGDIVTFVNHDWTYNYHDSVCPGYWNTGLLDVDESASLQFLGTGTYNYKDSQWYVLGMTGTIVVIPGTPVEPTPATLVDAQALPGGGFQFTISNLVAGASYTIQASTDMVNWSELTTRTAGSTVETYVDYEVVLEQRRFYRCWSLP